MNRPAPWVQAYLLLMAATLFWGGNAVAGKLASSDWPPMLLTTTRWLCALLILAPVVVPHLRRDWPTIRQHWALLLGLGAVGMGLFNVGLFSALHYTSAINVSIEQASMPVFIMIANFLFLSQRVLAWQVVGLLVSVAGVLITATQGQPWLFFEQGLNRGDGIMILACMAYAAYTFGLRWRPDMHWLSFLWCLAVGALTVSLPLTFLEMQSRPWPQLDGNSWLVLLYIVVFPTMMSQLAYARGVELIGANRAGLFINLVPVFGSVLAVLVVGEHFRLHHAIGLVLVIGGILLAESAARRSR